jgi:predicted transcriptional regulator
MISENFLANVLDENVSASFIDQARAIEHKDLLLMMYEARGHAFLEHIYRFYNSIPKARRIISELDEAGLVEKVSLNNNKFLTLTYKALRIIESRRNSQSFKVSKYPKDFILRSDYMLFELALRYEKTGNACEKVRRIIKVLNEQIKEELDEKGKFNNEKFYELTGKVRLVYSYVPKSDDITFFVLCFNPDFDDTYRIIADIYNFKKSNLDLFVFWDDDEGKYIGMKVDIKLVYFKSDEEVVETYIDKFRAEPERIKERIKYLQNRIGNMPIGNARERLRKQRDYLESCIISDESFFNCIEFEPAIDDDIFMNSMQKENLSLVRDMINQETLE